MTVMELSLTDAFGVTECRLAAQARVHTDELRVSHGEWFAATSASCCQIS